jgi:hypothetical protein
MLDAVVWRQGHQVITELMCGAVYVPLGMRVSGEDPT